MKHDEEKTNWYLNILHAVSLIHIQPNQSKHITMFLAAYVLKIGATTLIFKIKNMWKQSNNIFFSESIIVSAYVYNLQMFIYIYIIFI